MKIEKDIEKIFVETFVVKNKRDRSLFELNSKKKRKDFFSKLCHRYDQIIDSRYTTKLPSPNSSSEHIHQILKKYGAGKDCYLLSYFKDLDRKTMLLSEALEQRVGRGMPNIVICNPNKLAYFEAEQEVGSPPRFIIKKK
jgi:hypothetical protein